MRGIVEANSICSYLVQGDGGQWFFFGLFLNDQWPHGRPIGRPQWRHGAICLRQMAAWPYIHPAKKKKRALRARIRDEFANLGPSLRSTNLESMKRFK